MLFFLFPGLTGGGAEIKAGLLLCISRDPYHTPEGNKRVLILNAEQYVNKNSYFSFLFSLFSFFWKHERHAGVTRYHVTGTRPYSRPWTSWTLGFKIPTSNQQTTLQPSVKGLGRIIIPLCGTECVDRVEGLC